MDLCKSIGHYYLTASLGKKSCRQGTAQLQKQVPHSVQGEGAWAPFWLTTETRRWCLYREWLRASLGPPSHLPHCRPAFAGFKLLARAGLLGLLFSPQAPGPGRLGRSHPPAKNKPEQGKGDSLSKTDLRDRSTAQIPSVCERFSASSAIAKYVPWLAWPGTRGGAQKGEGGASVRSACYAAVLIQIAKYRDGPALEREGRYLTLRPPALAKHLQSQNRRCQTRT